MSKALEALRGTLSEGAIDLLNLLAVFPSLIGGLRSIGDFFSLGPKSLSARMYVSRPSGTAHVMSTADAAQLATANPMSCVTLTAGWVLPSAPDRITCAMFTAADLDGDGAQDVVAVWRVDAPSGTSPSGMTDEGAVAFLDDGSTRSVAEPFATWGLAGKNIPTVVGEPAQDSVRVASLTADRRQQVLFAAAAGGSTMFYGLLALGADGGLHMTTAESGSPAILPSGGGLNYPFGIGCVEHSGLPYLALAQAIPAISGDLSGSKTWSVGYYSLQDTMLSYAGRAAGYTDGLSGIIAESGGSCSQHPYVEMARIDKEPATPVAAATYLLGTAVDAGQGLAYARSVLGGPDTDSLSYSGTGYDDGRIWETLGEAIAPDPSRWRSATVDCSEPFHPPGSDPAGTANAPTLVNCTILNAPTLLHMLAEKSQHGWVVIAVTAKGE
jgi:hypothetical protein